MKDSTDFVKTEESREALFSLFHHFKTAPSSSRVMNNFGHLLKGLFPARVVIDNASFT